MIPVLPPYATLLGLRVEAGDDGLVLVMPFGADVLGRPGFVHGGALAGLLEIAGGVAVRSALGEAPATVTAVTITTDYLRGGRERETRAAAIPTRLGTRVANVVATAWQDNRDAPIAQARINYLIERG